MHSMKRYPKKITTSSPIVQDPTIVFSSVRNKVQFLHEHQPLRLNQGDTPYNVVVDLIFKPCRRNEDICNTFLAHQHEPVLLVSCLVIYPSTHAIKFYSPTIRPTLIATHGQDKDEGKDEKLNKSEGSMDLKGFEIGTLHEMKSLLDFANRIFCLDEDQFYGHLRCSPVETESHKILAHLQDGSKHDSKGDNPSIVSNPFLPKPTDCYYDQMNDLSNVNVLKRYAEEITYPQDHVKTNQKKAMLPANDPTWLAICKKIQSEFGINDFSESFKSHRQDTGQNITSGEELDEPANKMVTNEDNSEDTADDIARYQNVPRWFGRKGELKPKWGPISNTIKSTNTNNESKESGKEMRAHKEMHSHKKQEPDLLKTPQIYFSQQEMILWRFKTHSIAEDLKIPMEDLELVQTLNEENWALTMKYRTLFRNMIITDNKVSNNKSTPLVDDYPLITFEDINRLSHDLLRIQRLAVSQLATIADLAITIYEKKKTIDMLKKTWSKKNSCYQTILFSATLGSLCPGVYTATSVPKSSTTMEVVGATA